MWDLHKEPFAALQDPFVMLKRAKTLPQIKYHSPFVSKWTQTGIGGVGTGTGGTNTWTLNGLQAAFSSYALRYLLILNCLPSLIGPL